MLQYRRGFYELLRRHLAEAGIELTLIHSNPPPHADVWKDAIDLPWSHRVEPRRFSVGTREVLWQPCIELLAGSDLVIVEQATRHLLNFVLAAEQRLGRRKVALWGHGRTFDPSHSRRVSEWVKARLSLSVHWWFAYTERSAAVVEALGYPRERITVVQNAVDTRWLADAVNSLDASAAAHMRDELELTGSHVGVFLGKFAVEKRLGYVFEAADAVRQRIGDFELIVAGAGSNEPLVRRLAATRPWVRVVGPRFGHEKAALLRVADVLLVPAWAGLVVLDAFAAGVPLAVSASQPHPPENSYLRDGVNGLVVEDGGSAVAFGHAVAELLEDPSLRATLRAGCRAARGRYSIEEMVSRFGNGVQQALAA